MKMRRIFAGVIAMAMTMGMMSSLVIADEADNTPEETSVVETTETKEKVTKKQEENKPAETVKETTPAESEDEKPVETAETKAPQPKETEPSVSKKEEPAEPTETETVQPTKPDHEEVPETTVTPEIGDEEAAHSVKPKNAVVEITSVSITLDAPVVGETGDYTPFLPNGANYKSSNYDDGYGWFSNGIRWTDKDKSFSAHLKPNVGVFEEGRQYKVTIVLLPKSGYKFTSSTTAKVNGETADQTQYHSDDGDLWVVYTFPKCPNYIKTVSITLDKPVPGAKPDYTAEVPSGVNYGMESTNSGNYRRGVCWYDLTTSSYLDPDSAVFMAGHKYSVSIRLRSYSGVGYYFKKNTTTVMLNGKPATISNFYNDSIAVEYTFPDRIATVDIKLDAPAVGAKPDYVADFPSGAKYYSQNINESLSRNDISWNDLTVTSFLNPASAAFIDGHQYQVIVYITAKDGFYFDANTTATVNDKSAEASINGSKLCVIYTFPKLNTPVIPSVSITLDAPAKGAKPDYTAIFPSDATYYSDSFTSGYWCNDITWIDETTTSNVMPDDVFLAGHQYKVIVFLTAKGGYQFNNSTTATLNGHTVDDASIYEKQLKVTYIFPALEGPGLGDIEIVDNVIYKITNANKDGTGTVTVTGVEVKQASVSVPATVVINGVTYKVNRIGTKAFYGDKTLQSVYIGDNVVIIDASVFYGCSNLLKVSGGKALKTIGSSAFALCTKLKTFVITSPVLYKIGTYAFNKDSKLKTIYIRNTVKLTKSGVKKSLKGSKVKTVKVKKSKVKKYKKYFKKSNSGRSVKVKK